MTNQGFAIDLSGKTALVTGAGRHTGRAFSQGLAEAGAHVLVNDIALDQAQAVSDEIVAAGGSAEPAVFDITDLEACRKAIGSAGVDIVVNNVGGTDAITWPPTHFDQTDPTKWSKFVDLNLYGVLNTSHATLPHMVDKGWGRFITIVSDASRKGERGMAVYGAAKAAGAGFMRGLATEYGPQGITANVISFGAIAYEHHPAPSAENLKKMVRPYAIKRQGKPTDPVGLLVLLASDASSWITGQVIPVDGGFTNAL